MKASLFYLPTVGNRRELRRVSPACGPSFISECCTISRSRCGLPTISATTRSALPSITFTSKALRSPITRFCSIFTLRCRQSASGLGAGRPRGVDREGLCVGRNGRHGYPHTRKAAPPAADRLGVLLHLINSLVPHDVLMKTIERFWTEVMPRVA